MPRPRRRFPRAPDRPWAAAAAAAAALVAACGTSNADICQRGIARRQACDPNLALGAAAVAACQVQLDHESHTCHNGAILLAACLAQAPCANAVSACRSQQEVVDLNCSRDPLAPP